MKGKMFSIEEEPQPQLVKVKNPIILGIQIAIGMFIVFPLFMLVIFVVFGSMLAS